MNKKLLKNICDTKKLLSLHCKARIMTVSKIRDLQDMEQWYYVYCISNILSLNNIKKKYRVTYDSVAHDCFEVHKEDGTKHVLKPSNSRINNDIVLNTIV